LIEEIFHAQEAISISISNETNSPIFEPKVGETPLWETVNISALFDREITKKNISEILNLIPYDNLSVSQIKDKNWVLSYQKDFQPRKFGKKLWVYPSWAEIPYKTNKVILKMDPGLAFGTGSHQTTHLCLEYLDKNPPKGDKVLDYGCGSGILGIAALKLGAKKTFATDIDPQALIATKINSKKNNLNENIFISIPEDFKNIKVDILIANIFINSLIELKDDFCRLLKSGGRLILSGILKSQIHQVCNSYNNNFAHKNIKYKDEWCLIEFKKK